MTIVVLLILAGVWGVVLYGYVKDRLADVRPADSIGTFRRQLSILERTGPQVRSPQDGGVDEPFRRNRTPGMWPVEGFELLVHARQFC